MNANLIRFVYDPTMPDSKFEAMFDARFGKATGKDLLAAWKLASRVPLHFASFHKGTWDGSLDAEGFFSWTDRENAAPAIGDAGQQRVAVAELEKALVRSKRLAEVTEKFDQLTVASNWRPPFSWTLLIPDVDRDIEVARVPLASINSLR